MYMSQGLGCRHLWGTTTQLTTAPISATSPFWVCPLSPMNSLLAEWFPETTTDAFFLKIIVAIISYSKIFQTAVNLWNSVLLTFSKS